MHRYTLCKEQFFFISGIDTNVGKTFATGLLARSLSLSGKKVITQKIIQTGCPGISEDIEMHRSLQGIPLTEDDLDGTTCPYVFTYPCSPHMAADKDAVVIDPEVITAATRKLQARYEYVLLEGAGGLMVPCNHDLLTIDYIQQQGYPVILVTSGVLGSINHTLLSLSACKQYGIPVKALIYNNYPHTDQLIHANTFSYLEQYLQKHFPDMVLSALPEVGEDTIPNWDVS
ncbi:MAG: dethiobiotin synthase, partial [Tannerellaceae bacterium]|nr:dethiobiotin synthase [Tannerellaceae bacterium]